MSEAEINIGDFLLLLAAPKDDHDGRMVKRVGKLIRISKSKHGFFYVVDIDGNEWVCGFKDVVKLC